MIKEMKRNWQIDDAGKVEREEDRKMREIKKEREYPNIRRARNIILRKERGEMVAL